MKRDAVNLNQLALFEPDEAEALQLMTASLKRWQSAQDAADLWDACWCPGARDAAERDAADAFRVWLHAALFLDLCREASL